MNEPIRDLVLEIYDTVTDPSRWGAVLDRVADKVDARGVILFDLIEKDGDRRLSAQYFSDVFKPEIIYPYMKHFKDLELEENDILSRLTGRTHGVELFCDADLFPDPAVLAARPNVKVLKSFDMHHRVFAILDKDTVDRSRISIQFSEAHGPMTSGEKLELERLLPHIAKALELGRPAAQLSQAHETLKLAMDRLKMGVCVLDPEGAVLLSNEEFDRQRRAYRVFQISKSNILRLSKPADQARLTTLIDDALSHGEFGARPRKEALTIAVGDEPSALCIEIAPLGNLSVLGDTGFGDAILYSLDASLPLDVNIEPMRQIYKLTPAECELADLLGRGLTNAQIADRRGRAVATINAQVKSLLAKTDSDNRTQFARLLLSFGADYVK